MVRARALQKCFINNVLRQEGEVFNYPGDVPPDSGVVIALDAEQPTAQPERPAPQNVSAPAVEAGTANPEPEPDPAE